MQNWQWRDQFTEVFPATEARAHKTTKEGDIKTGKPGKCLSSSFEKGRVNIKFDIDTIGHVQLDAPIYFRKEAI